MNTWGKLAAYYDYGWFVALIASIGTLIVSRYSMRGASEWRWLPWLAWAGVASATIELVSFVRTTQLTMGQPDYLGEDILLGLASSVAVIGWISRLSVKPWLRYGAVLATIAVALARFARPTEGAVALAMSGTIIAGLLALKGKTPVKVRIVLMLGAATLWTTAAGPLAGSGLQLRRWVAFNEWSALWSGAQAVIAVVIFFLVVAPLCTDDERGREWRVFLVVAAAWLVGGVLLAGGMSSWARHTFETQLLSRVRAASTKIQPEVLRELVNKDFEFSVRPEPRKRGHDESVSISGNVARLATPVGTAVRDMLSRIEDTEPGARQAYLERPLEDWLVIFGSSKGYRGRSASVVGATRPTADDLADLKQLNERFLPLLLDWATRSTHSVRARVPMVDQGQFLAWLIVSYPFEDWVQAQALSRLQTYVIVGLGFVLGVVFAAQRARTREREAARTAAELARQADRLKSTFLAKVSHELRTPIQSVLGYGELLESAVTEPTARRRLAALQEHGTLMLRLVNDLLDLSAIQAGAFRVVPKPTGLLPLVRETVDSLRPRAEAKGLAISLTVSDELLPWAEVDGERVRQVVINLVTNAIKFTDHGEVAVALENGARTDEIMLVVRDTGPGIPAEGMKRLFQPFERLEENVRKEGTGLGLALTAGICRSMGGDVSAESLLGSGATFRAWFRAPTCAEPMHSNESPNARPSLAGCRVLVADDNVLVRELFLGCLREAGAICTAAENGVRVLSCIEEQSFDAIILDVAMPRLDGIETARRLRAGGCRARIIGVSAHAAEDEKARAMAAGMDDFLIKPVGIETLLRAIAPQHRSCPMGDTERLIQQLQEQFHIQAGIEGLALAEAITRRDYKDAYARAHYLMNSAAVVRDDRLYKACERTERAARTEDPAILDEAWIDCETALNAWIVSPARSSA